MHSFCVQIIKLVVLLLLSKLNGVICDKTRRSNFNIIHFNNLLNFGATQKQLAAKTPMNIHTEQCLDQDTTSCEKIFDGASNDKIFSIKGGFQIAGREFGSMNAKTQLGIIKIILQVMLTGLNVLCWLVPLRSKNFFQSTSLLSMFNSFAGGVFLMLSFSHLIPHSIESFGKIGIGSMVAMEFALMGFILIFFLDKIAFDTDEVKEINEDTKIQNDDNTDGTMSLSGKSTAPTPPSQSALVLCTAMSAHSLIESVSLGLAADKTSAAIMAASIALHQPAESLALLVACIKTGMPLNKIALYLSLYSLVGIIGIITGVLVSAVTSTFLEAAVIAITAGTFVYVGAIEIVNEEFENTTFSEKIKRFIAFAAGLITIKVVTGVSSQWESVVA